MTGIRYVGGWTPEKIAQLRAMHADNAMYAAIGLALGVTPRAAIGMATRLGLGNRREAGIPWSETEFALLRELHADQKLSFVDIAQRIGRNRFGVEFMARKIGLFRGKRSSSPREARPRAPRKSAPGQPASQPKPAVVALPAMRRITDAADLKNHTCRFPIGRPHAVRIGENFDPARFYYCGADGADLAKHIPYCPYHHRLTHQPRTRLPRKSVRYSALTGAPVPARAGAA
jgi:hypothetical protein